MRTLTLIGYGTLDIKLPYIRHLILERTIVPLPSNLSTLTLEKVDIDEITVSVSQLTLVDMNVEVNGLVKRIYTYNSYVTLNTIPNFLYMDGIVSEIPRGVENVSCTNMDELYLSGDLNNVHIFNCDEVILTNMSAVHTDLVDIGDVVVSDSSIDTLNIHNCREASVFKVKCGVVLQVKVVDELWLSNLSGYMLDINPNGKVRIFGNISGNVLYVKQSEIYLSSAGNIQAEEVIKFEENSDIYLEGNMESEKIEVNDNNLVDIRCPLKSVIHTKIYHNEDVSLNVDSSSEGFQEIYGNGTLTLNGNFYADGNISVYSHEGACTFNGNMGSLDKISFHDNVGVNLIGNMSGNEIEVTDNGEISFVGNMQSAAKIDFINNGDVYIEGYFTGEEINIKNNGNVIMKTSILSNNVTIDGNQGVEQIDINA